MTCRELVELVTDYLSQMRGTIWALGHACDRTAAPSTVDELLRAFRGWRA